MNDRINYQTNFLTLSRMGRVWIAVFAATLSSSLGAQVFDPGPSDPNLFDVVIDLPSDQPEIFGSIGGDGMMTQVNVGSGGVVVSSESNPFDALSGSELNVIGGTVGDRLGAFAGSEVNIASGTVGDNFHAFEFSFVNISGGTVGNNFDVSSMVNISGGTVGNDFDARTGSVVSISGGTVGDHFDAFADSEVNIVDGTVGDHFDALSESFVNISGGTIGNDFNTNSMVNISGGTVGNDFEARTGSVVSISGGSVGDEFTALSGSMVHISGGLMGDEFSAVDGSAVNVFGTSFEIDGVPLGALTLNVPHVIEDRDVTLSGVLTDGQQFSFALNSTSNTGEDFFDEDATVTVTLTGATGVFGIGPSNSFLFDNVINLPAEQADIYGGVGGDGMATQVNVIAGGNVNDSFFATVGGEVNIDGGTVGDFFEARSGSEVNISGGIIGDLFVVRGGMVNISGGGVGEVLTAFTGSQLNISGGTVGDRFAATSSSEVNLMGTEFLLDGIRLDSLVLDEPYTIVDRGVELSGLLADGTPFSFDLNSTFVDGEDFFSADAALTVTLVDRVLLGDVNGDGDVNLLDVAPFVDALTGGPFVAAADINGDGEINLLDVSPFVNLLV